jgi:hypothetical protein
MSHRFRTSARKAENGFVADGIVSSRPSRRNIRGKNVSYFNDRRLEVVPDGPDFPAPEQIAGYANQVFSPAGENR